MIKLKLAYLFLLFLYLPISHASDDIQKTKGLLGNWRIEAIHNGIKSIELNNCGLGSIDIRQSGVRAVSLYSCFNNNYVKRCTIPDVNGALSKVDTTDEDFLCRIDSGGNIPFCSVLTACNDVMWQCRYLKLGDTACKALNDVCQAKVQRCDSYREKILGPEEEAILYGVSNYTFSEGELNLSNDFGAEIQLKRVTLPPELKAVKNEYERKEAALQAKHPSSVVYPEEYGSFNWLQVSYLAKEALYNSTLSPYFWYNDRDDDFIGTNFSNVSDVVACPKSIDWHPSQAITHITYKNNFKWSWRKHRLQNGQDCLIMLSPLLGPLDQKDLQAFISEGNVEPFVWLQKILSTKQYELHSSTNETICLPSNGSAWWDKQDDFFKAEKFVFNDIKPIGTLNTSFDGKASEIKLGKQIAAQKASRYLAEHAQIWKDTWRDISASDITPSDHIDGYFEVIDKRNPRIVHIVNSKKTPTQLNHQALNW